MHGQQNIKKKTQKSIISLIKKTQRKIAMCTYCNLHKSFSLVFYQPYDGYFE